MKKLLSLLGSIGMVATAGMAVVACGSKNSDNASASYSDFSKWVDASKAKDSNGQVTNQIVFIGGRKDSDSLSWLAAESLMADSSSTNWQDIKKLTDSKNISSVDSSFSKFISGKDDYRSLTSNSQATPGSGISNPITQQFVWGKDKDAVTPNSNIGFHSVLVDTLSSFWSSSLGKDIKDKLISDQVNAGVDFYFSDENMKKPLGKDPDKAIKNIKSANKKAINKVLSGDGPFFLMISNGKLVGISQGYQNYSQFVKADNDKLKKITAEIAKDDFKIFNNYLRDNIYQDNINTLMGSFFVTDKINSDSKIIKDIKTLNKDWADTSEIHSTVDKINLAQLSFNVDLNKYN